MIVDVISDLKLFVFIIFYFVFAFGIAGSILEKFGKKGLFVMSDAFYSAILGD